MPLQPGDTFATKYHIESEIGRGAYGRVYRARDLSLDRVVAIKELHKTESGIGSTTFADYERRFRREARVQARFNHPNMVHVYELLEPEPGALYLVMECADGGSLKELLEKRGSLPIDEAARLTREVLAGLAAVHDDLRDIVHRDIKPSNILLTKDGHAKLCDFGLAQVGDESMRSGSGEPHPGTAVYMSPEQETSSGYLYPASDIFSAGCVLFELLTGVPYKKAKRDRKTLRDLRPDAAAIEAVLLKALDRDPETRHESAEAFGNALVKVQAGWVNERKEVEEKAKREAEEREQARKAEEKRKIREAEEESRANAAREEAQRYYNDGIAAHDRKDYDTAIADKSKAIELDPAKAKYYRSRGLSYFNKGDYDRAIADINKAIELDPHNASDYQLRGASYNRKKDYDRAIADYNKAIELDATKAECYEVRGSVYYLKKDYDRAIADFNKAIELDATEAEYYEWRSMSYDEKKDYDRAIADCNKAIELDPTKAQYYKSRGVSYYNKGDYDRAVADHNKAIELDPTKANYYYSRNLSYRAKGDTARADADLAKARQLGYKE